MRLSRKLLYNADTLKTELLHTRICDLRLRLRGSRLGRCVDRAMDDVRAFGITLEPFFYLSDAYGCVEGTANIGLGFWDADPLLREIRKDKTGQLRDDVDIALLVKHEVGHAFCYSHKLYLLPEFRRGFGIRGNFFRTYPDDGRYRFDRWSVDHVNPVGDHYAQKHPDDDFAETFATFLDPKAAWRDRYRGRIGALRKIALAARLVRQYGGRTPAIRSGGAAIHGPLDEFRQTVAQFFRVARRRYMKHAQGFLDDELEGIFRTPGRLKKPTTAAAALLLRHRKFIEASVRARVRPKDPQVAADVLDKIAHRLKAIDLVYFDDEQDRVLAELYGMVLVKTLLFHRFGVFRET